MRAYTFTEKAREGLRLRRTQSRDIILEVGEDVAVAVSPQKKEFLDRLEDSYRQRASGVVGFLPLIDRRTKTGHIKSAGWVSPAMAEVRLREIEVEGFFESSLNYDAEQGGLVYDRRSPGALLHVDTQTDTDGELTYLGDDYKVVRDGRVGRGYAQFPGTGVEVLAQASGPNGEAHTLLRLLPGASVRMRRSNSGDEWAERLLVFTGYALLEKEPKTGEKRKKAAQA